MHDWYTYTYVLNKLTWQRLQILCYDSCYVSLPESAVKCDLHAAASEVGHQPSHDNIACHLSMLAPKLQGVCWFQSAFDNAGWHCMLCTSGCMYIIVFLGHSSAAQACTV